MARHYSLLDYFLKNIDQSIRTVFASAAEARSNPAQKIAEPILSTEARRESAALMRVNHAGEVSAQALYHAQALTARSKKVRDAMTEAATEENDHLAWCQQRVKELGGHTSYLNPLWYAGSFAMGVCAGLAGDKWNLGFLAETEQQVVKHLDQHLMRLPQGDKKSYQILIQMREDEAHHATTAHTTGAAELPTTIKVMMRCFSKVMTRVSFWV